MWEQVADGVASRSSAEIDAQREHQLNKACARLAQLENRAPEKIRENHTHEIKVLAERGDEPACKVTATFVNDRIGEKCSRHQKQHSCLPDVTAYLHLTEDLLVKANDDPEHQDR